MPAATDFDAFYLTSRRRLVLQAYALTGDLAASRTAVRDAFVAASHRWRKVSRLPDPEEWVRPLAWSTAQRRHVARLWRRDKALSEEQRAVLSALHHLSDPQRRALLLLHLAALPVAEVGRELGRSAEAVRDLLTEATARFLAEAGGPADAADPTDPTDPAVRAAVLGAVEVLAPVAEAASLPEPGVVHRRGRRRRGGHTAAGAAVLALVTLAGGFFVSAGQRATVDPAADRRAEAVAPREVSRAMLLSLEQVGSMSAPQTWQVTETSDNTAGTGINSVCQSARFADPRGEQALVRKFAAAGAPRRTLVQTVEVSRSPEEAAAAYRTATSWFAGCQQARLQLLNAYDLEGLGDQAQLLRLRIPTQVRRTYVVGLARTGSVTVSTVLETLDGAPPRLTDAVRGLTDAVRNVCMTTSAGECPMFTTVEPVLPPLSGEARGTLAVADLPPVGRIAKPWVGTQPVPARVNVAATTCDKADFLGAGAVAPLSRTFLIPQARLPKRFGITETYGRFRRPKRAAAFVAEIRADMASCEKRDLGAQVSQELYQARGYRGSELALWRLDSEINEEEQTVGYWMGVTRVGGLVAQVNFTSAPGADIDADSFQALVTRARDRLFELSVR